MKALLYRKSIPRYALLRWIGPRARWLYTSSVSPVSLRDVPDPTLPTEQWVRIAPRLAGVCGSDLATLRASGSAYFAPITSMPFVLGHELVGTIVEVGSGAGGLKEGDRVVLRPALGCRARGIEPLCDACRSGRDALCRNVTRGDISAGIQTGYCRDTGGGFGENLVAHRSQVYVIPKEVDDTAAVLLEPFACALHGVLRASLTQGQTALVIGCGAIGLLTIAAIRATGCQARIVAVAKHDHQREHACRLGADEILTLHGLTSDRYAAWAKALDGEAFDPELGKPTVIGGADVTFDCVASSHTIDDALRFTRSAGAVVLVGMPGIPTGVDWTPLWYKELTIHAAYAYGPERCADGSRETFDIALDLMRTWGPELAPLVGTPYELTDYRAAFAAALNTGTSKAIKTVFAVNPG